MFRAGYVNVFDGDARWQAINGVASDTYQWRTGSTYVANTPYFEGMNMTPAPVSDLIEAKPLAIFADSITTDHISPAGSIKAASPAGLYLQEHQEIGRTAGRERGGRDVRVWGFAGELTKKNTTK